jgi:hypothetical protein
MTFDHVEDGTLAVVELVGHFGEFLNFLNGMGNVLGEYFVLALINGSLGGGCPRVND